MLIEFTIGIGAHLATDLIKHGGARFLDKTKLGAKLKEKFHLLDNSTEDEFKKVLLEAYATYFSKYPDRQFTVFYDFFASDEVSSRLFNFVFDFQPIEYAGLENALHTRMGRDWILFRILEQKKLTIRRIIEEFINCYSDAEKKSVGLGLLLVLREIKDSEQKIVEKTTVELRNTGDRIINSVIGNLGSHLIALEDELRGLGVNSKDISTLHSLNRDARRIEYGWHELQTILTAMMAYSENLSSRVSRTDSIPTKIKDDAKEILGLSRILHYTIQNVMGYEEIAGYRFALLNIGIILQSSAEMYERMARHRYIEILIESKEKAFPSLEASPPIKLAIHNLMHNAVRYSFAGTPHRLRQVLVWGERYGNYYKVSFKNYGVPIPHNEYEKVFEDGFRSAAAKELGPIGMGRGLYVAKNIISHHNGTIRAYSNQDEGGYSTTVEMLLPYTQATLMADSDVK